MSNLISKYKTMALIYLILRLFFLELDFYSLSYNLDNCLLYLNRSVAWCSTVLHSDVTLYNIIMSIISDIPTYYMHIPTKHLFILVPEPLWHLICTNFLQGGRKFTFGYYFGLICIIFGANLAS